LTDNCRIKIVRIVGRQVGILFDAPKEVAIWRTELLPLIN
jgi:sRNA-binding carbon storage regulator CsrA